MIIKNLFKKDKPKKDTTINEVLPSKDVTLSDSVILSNNDILKKLESNITFQKQKEKNDMIKDKLHFVSYFKEKVMCAIMNNDYKFKFSENKLYYLFISGFFKDIENLALTDYFIINDSYIVTMTKPELESFLKYSNEIEKKYNNICSENQ